MTSVQPPVPAPPASTPAPAPVPANGTTVPADVAKLPPSLETVDRALSLRGEVQQVNSDGTVRITTPRGPIDVKLPEGQVVTRGQSVEVQVPAGSPPRDVSVTLPQTQPQATPRPLPAPPVPVPPASTPAQNAPAPTPAPQTPASGPSAPPPSAPTPSPAQSIPTPTPSQSPAQTPLPQTPPSASPQPAGQAVPHTANTPLPATQAAPTTISPQGLLEFLKTSLQTILKTPQAVPNQTIDPLANVQQRPLQIGQLVRLLPLTAAQNPATSPLPSAPTASVQPPVTPLAAQISQNLAGNLTPAPQTNLVMLLPATTTPSQATPLQGMMQTVLGPTVNLGMPQLPTIDPVARLLLPFFTIPSPAAPTLPGQSAPTILTQLALVNFIQPQKTDGPVPHTPILATPQTGQSVPAQQILDARISGMLPMPTQTASAPAMTSLLHGSPTMPTLFAQVTGQTPQGLPIVTLPTFTVGSDGTPKPAAPTMMVLQFPAKGLAPATVLKLDVLQTPTTSFAPMAESITWDGLDEILRSLPNQPQSQAAMQAVQAAIPKPGSAAFTAPVLMFVAAMRGGDITAWMGDKGMEAIRNTRRPEALSRILNDFTNSTRRADDSAPSSEWRGITLPMLYGPDLSRVQLHYRSFERDDPNNEDSKKTGTRFLLDLNLTRMGAMQIDGFSIEKKLDVILRTERPLSPAMRETMRTRYYDAMSGIGFVGELNFRADPGHKEWVSIN